MNPLRGYILPVSRAAYLMQCGLFLLVAISISLSSFALGSGPYAISFYLMALLAFTAPWMRRWRMPRTALILESVSFAPLGGLLTVAGTIMGASVSKGFVDDWLVRGDRMLGYDWLSVFQFSRLHPTAVHILDFAYASMFPQMILVPISLALMKREKPLWSFLTAWTLALLMTTLLFPAFPARGALLYFGIGPDALSKDWFWQFGPRIDALQHGSMRNLSSAAMGIVTVPSFHACAAVLFAWIGRTFRYLGWPLVALNVLMILSTLVSGAHYLVDVIAGVLVALASIVASKTFVAREGFGATW